MKWRGARREREGQETSKRALVQISILGALRPVKDIITSFANIIGMFDMIFFLNHCSGEINING